MNSGNKFVLAAIIIAVILVLGIRSYAKAVRKMNQRPVTNSVLVDIIPKHLYFITLKFEDGTIIIVDYLWLDRYNPKISNRYRITGGYNAYFIRRK